MNRAVKLGLEISTLQFVLHSILKRIQLLHEGRSKSNAIFFLGIFLRVWLQYDVVKSLLTIEHIVIQELGKIVIHILPFFVERFLILIRRQLILVSTHFASRINTASQFGDEAAK